MTILLTPTKVLPVDATAQSTSDNKRSFQVSLRGLFTAAGALLCLATVLGFFGKWWWFADLFSHFRVQYLIGSALIAALLALGRRFRPASALAVAAALNLALVTPLFIGRTDPPAKQFTIHSVMLMNVNTRAGDPVRVAQVIRKSRPDILVLEEVSDEWLAALCDVLRTYLHALEEPRNDNFGIALYSRYPLTNSSVIQIGEAKLPSILTQIQMPEGLLTILATHPLPPAGAELSRLRNDQLDKLPALIRDSGKQVLLIGDLNTTPFSPHFTRLQQNSGLRNAAQGRGILATWPTDLPLFKIQLDHFLHSRGIMVHDVKVGPAMGSDHLPLILEFGIGEPRGSAVP